MRQAYETNNTERNLRDVHCAIGTGRIYKGLRFGVTIAPL
jgi:hypothetical protein